MSEQEAAMEVDVPGTLQIAEPPPQNGAPKEAEPKGYETIKTEKKEESIKTTESSSKPEAEGGQIKSESERSEKKHKHKHKHHHHDKEKHKSSHHDKHKSHHHDKEKHKSHHHDKPHKSKMPDPTFGKSSIFGKTMDATDVSRMLAEPIDHEIDGDDFQILEHKKMKDGLPVSPPKRKRTRTADGVPIPGMNIDVDKKFLKPFQEGWKREIVLRNPANEIVGVGGGKPKADVYYYAPKGKKLRSMREIEDYIDQNPNIVGDVTINNFTWAKGAIYQAPDEVVRTAADRVGRQAGTPTIAKKFKDDPSWERAKKKIKEAKFSPSGPVLKSGGEKHKHRTSSGKLPVKFNFSPFPSKTSSDGIKQVAKKGTGVAKKSTGKKPSSGGIDSLTGELKRPTQRLCGLNCPGREGMPPSLQCGICMCLFHPSCVGQSGAVPSMYVCPTCSTPAKPKSSAPVAMKSTAKKSNGGQVLGQIVNGTEPKGPISTHAIPPNVMSNLQPNTPISGQLLTLPSSVLSKVNSQQPLSLKVNNQKLVIPPNCFISTPDGVKVFLPAGTLPPAVFNAENKAANMKLNVNEKQNQQDLSLLPEGGEKSPASSNGSNTPECLAPKDSTCYFEKLQIGVDVILNIFRFLPHCDLLRAAQVCQMWKKVAEHQSLWKTVWLRKSRVSQWETAAEELTKHGTRTLDLRGMLFYEDKNRTWHQLTSVLHQMTELRKIYLSQAPAHMLHTIADRLVDLEGLVAEQVFDADQTYKPTILQTTKLDVGKFCNLKKLTELKVRSPNGLSLPPFSFSGGLQGLAELKCLKALSITSLREAPAEKFGFLPSLLTLEDLELGDCLTFTEETYEGLGKLIGLKRLRLECGGEDMDEPLSKALKNLTSIERLELIRFQIGKNLKDALKGLGNLRKISVWPDGGNQAAAINTNTLNAVMDLTKLKSLDWGIMMDDGTSIILDENDDGGDAAEKASKYDSEKKTECIPFLPQKAENGEAEGTSGDVELMPEYTSIAQLVERLCSYLPDTKIRVFRIPVLNAVPVVNAFA